MYHRGSEKSFASFGLAEKSRTILREDLPLSQYDPVVAEEVVNFRFLRCTLLWLDIVFSITAGTAPQLPPHHFCVASSNSQTKLEEVMSCKNWVMLLIGRIAALYEYKARASQQGHFDPAEFDQTADDISREIQCGLAEETLEGFAISEGDPAAGLNAMPDPPTLVTKISAHMATVYLHLITHGFQYLEVLDTTVSTVMRILQTRISIQLLPALVCPLFIIGSVVGPRDEAFFRNIFSSPPSLDAVLKHRERLLPILEEIWSRRQTKPGLEWKDALELTRDILLL